jgi:nitrite reductase/ring-hydroxylating ferredoxin subunit/uncharacterized membrane protein
MKALLERKVLRHPLHSVLVHLPLGFFFLSLILDLASLAWPDAVLVRGAFYSIGLGLLTALAAAIPGMIDYTDIRRDHPARRIATTHMLLNLLAVALYAVNAGVRAGQLGETQTPVVPLVLSIAGAWLLFVSGYLGGKLVYNNGIGVGRHRRSPARTEGTLCILSSSIAPEDLKEEGGKRFVPVTSTERLPEGPALRVNIDGTVMALVNSGGEFFAFQEFCTHRFGPLSEGALDGEHVECPWHRSCFDMRTGAVIRGPAKVNLRIFPVKVVGKTLFVGMEVGAKSEEMA